MHHIVQNIERSYAEKRIFLLLFYHRCVRFVLQFFFHINTVHWNGLCIRHLYHICIDLFMVNMFTNCATTNCMHRSFSRYIRANEGKTILKLVDKKFLFRKFISVIEASFVTPRYKYKYSVCMLIYKLSNKVLWRKK